MIASSVRAYHRHRRLRHLRQIFCRGLDVADSLGCYFILSDSVSNRQLFRSAVCMESHNPSWETLPFAFLNSYGSVCRFDIHIYGVDADKLLFKVLNVDMRSIRFLSKTMSSVPLTSTVCHGSILLGCQDGIYTTDSSTHNGGGIMGNTNGNVGNVAENDIYDCVVLQDDPQLSSRIDRTRVDAIQSWGVSLLAMAMELDMLHDRYATVAHWANEKSINNDMKGGKESVLDYELLNQQRINLNLKHMVFRKRAAFKKTASAQLVSLASDINRIEQDMSGTFHLSEDYTRNACYESELEKTRREVVSQLNSFFSVDTSQSKINNCKIPDKDGFPESPEQAQGLGHICHILTVTSSLYDFSFPHPIFLCGDHSRIGEHRGVDVDMYLPLYICKGYDKHQLRRAFEWLKEDIVNIVDFVLVINSKVCMSNDKDTYIPERAPLSPTSYCNTRELFHSPVAALKILLDQH